MKDDGDLIDAELQRLDQLMRDAHTSREKAMSEYYKLLPCREWPQYMEVPKLEEIVAEREAETLALEEELGTFVAAKLMKSEQEIQAKEEATLAMTVGSNERTQAAYELQALKDQLCQNRSSGGKELN